MEYAALSDVGVKRFNNEDSYVVNTADEEKLFIVADGMGGHNAGEIASREACRITEGYILEKHGEDIEQVLRDSVLRANRDIFVRASENAGLKGMGTTIEACVLRGKTLYGAHVGDSGVFVIGKDKIRKITKDHSIVGMMLDAGTITEEEAKVHPQRHYITRAVGTSITLEVDIIKEEIEDGELILMCTDGLTNMVSKEDIHSIVTEARNVSEAVNALVKRAKDNGGDDNITVILLEV